MFDQNNKPSILRAAVSTPIGILLFIFVFAFIVGISAWALFTLPVRLGLIQQLQSEDVITIQIPGTTSIKLSETTDHQVFVQRRIQFPHNLTIQSKATGEFINLEEQDGDIYYDTDLLEGLLIYKFKVEEPGMYEISESLANPSETLLIAPSFSKRNSIVLALFLGIPLLFIGIGGWYFYFRPTARDTQLAKERNNKLDRWLELQSKDDAS